MADHTPGEMDTTAQEKTFDGFISLVSKTAVGIIIFLIFLALVNG